MFSCVFLVQRANWIHLTEEYDSAYYPFIGLSIFIFFFKKNTQLNSSTFNVPILMPTIEQSN